MLNTLGKIHIQLKLAWHAIWCLQNLFLAENFFIQEEIHRILCSGKNLKMYSEKSKPNLKCFLQSVLESLDISLPDLILRQNWTYVLVAF